VFAKNCFTNFLPIHEFSKLLWHPLNFMALSTGDTEEGKKFGRRRRRSITRRSARTWCSSRTLGFVLTPYSAARAVFHRHGWHSRRSRIFGFIFTAARMATTPSGAWLMAPEDSLCVVNDQPVGNPKRKV
jgi:hypothetical protein